MPKAGKRIGYWYFTNAWSIYISRAKLYLKQYTYVFKLKHKTYLDKRYFKNCQGDVNRFDCWKIDADDIISAHVSKIIF